MANSFPPFFFFFHSRQRNVSTHLSLSSLPVSQHSPVTHSYPSISPQIPKLPLLCLDLQSFPVSLIVPTHGYVLVSGRHWSRRFTKLAAYLFVIMPQWAATFWFDTAWTLLLFNFFFPTYRLLLCFLFAFASLLLMIFVCFLHIYPSATC